MIQPNTLVARQRYVKRASICELASPTVLRTVEEATVGEVALAWRPTIGWTGLSSGLARCYTGRTLQEESGSSSNELKETSQ
jgi:hypothetical protein